MLTIAARKWAFECLAALRAQYAIWYQRGVFKQQIAKERRELLHLDQRMLSDIGRTREEALCEALRSSDDLPKMRLEDNIAIKTTNDIEMNFNTCKCEGKCA